MLSDRIEVWQFGNKKYIALGVVSIVVSLVKEAQKLMRHAFMLVPKTEFLAYLTNTTPLKVARHNFLLYLGALLIRQTFSRNSQILVQVFCNTIKYENLLNKTGNALLGILGENLHHPKSILRSL